jgi:hypothetical protein
MQGAISRKCLFKIMRHIESLLHAAASSAVLREHASNVGNQSIISRTKEPVHIENAGQCPYRVCASAEAEQVDVVIFSIGIHQKSVRVADITEKAISECQALQARPLLLQAISGCRRAHRAHARMVIAKL